MPALGFKVPFAAKVLEGSKTFTLRHPRRDGRDHPLGCTLHLFTGMRTKACRRFATTTVVGRGTLIMGPAGIVEVVNPALAGEGHASGAAGDIMEDLITAARFPAGPLTPERLARIAVGDGFPDWPAMWAFHEAQGVGLEGHASRELYIFGPVHAADDAAEASDAQG